MYTLKVSDRMADEIRDWAKDQQDYWPDDTEYQRDLSSLLRQLDAGLPTADDVRGILND